MPGKHPHGAGNPVPLNEVLWDELALLERHDGTAEAPELRKIYETLGEPDGRPLTAFCISGGGIRSATFNLGVLQALAKLRLLDQFDYVSSVSGGGYIAGWLRAWCHHLGNVTDVANALADPAAAPDFRPLAPEPTPVDHLREYSNYLTPRLGFFSADTWALGATIVRNLILNWLVLIPALAAVVAVPQIALIVATGSPDAHDTSMASYSQGALALAIVSAICSAIALHYFRRQRRTPAPELTILGVGLVPLWLACLFLAVSSLWRNEAPEPAALAAFSAFWCAGIPLIGWTVARIAAGHQPHAPSDRSEMAGVVGSGLAVTVPFFFVARDLLPLLRQRPSLFVICAVPILLALYLLARTLFVALSSVGEREERVRPPAQPPTAWAAADREWWARCSGWVGLAATTWMAASALVVLGAYAVSQLGAAWHTFLAASGGLSGLITSRLGSSPGTKGSNHADRPVESPLKDIALKTLAPLTVVLVVLLLAELTIWASQYTTDYTSLLRVSSLTYRQPLDSAALVSAVGGFALVQLLFILASWALGWVVNVNRFSLHGMYRDRLMRAYLGASNAERDPDPFTGFDPGDNVQLHELAHDGAPRPILVVNTTLNLVKSAEHLAWQQRKAESFSMTPLYCGNFHEGYRPSKDYGGPNGVSLATAITISGAAASPNGGYHSSPIVTFLMTLFNARLGCWLGNTNAHGAATFRRSGPVHAGSILFSELLGFTDAEHPYINLSDGGHFENLAIYEMVLRRCRYIVASDAGQDPNHDFEDLGNAVRKIRIDFGIPITFESPIKILPRAGNAGPGLAFAVGRIGYNVVDPGAQPGWLLYLKPTLLAPQGPPYDVVSYSRSSKLFPHESTTDQWFSEAQFESYRALGESLGQQLAASAPPDLPSLIEAVRLELLRPNG
ncbi:MAG: patatin-like phospholipase family protein [Acidobacteriia bacterium]|nr:patatin-like phospholipase family protein [Terriglobia bacterium]